MTNRLAQHFAAIMPAKPPVPRRGSAHFAVVVYSVQENSPGWKPKHESDSLRSLEWGSCRYAARHLSIVPALWQIRQFNGNMLRNAEGDSPDRWAAIASVDNGSPKVLEHFARMVTPLAFHCLRILTPTKWQPASLLDVPPVRWSEEAQAIVHDEQVFETLAEAVNKTVEANRLFAVERKKPLARWSIISACEAEPLHGVTIFDGNGESRTGTQAQHRVDRFHIVDRTWLDAATLAAIDADLEGGAL